MKEDGSWIVLAIIVLLAVCAVLLDSKSDRERTEDIANHFQIKLEETESKALRHAYERAVGGYCDTVGELHCLHDNQVAELCSYFITKPNEVEQLCGSSYEETRR